MGSKGVESDAFMIAIEVLRKQKRTTLGEFSKGAGLPVGTYTSVNRGIQRTTLAIKTALLGSENITEVEKEFLMPLMVKTVTTDKEKEQLITDALAVSVKALQEMNRGRPHRIRNIPVFYKKLHSLEETQFETMLRRVEPNDPRLQEIRKLLGVNPIWDNPEPPQHEGDARTGTSLPDRREAVDSHFWRSGHSVYIK